jgi:hypothetical protein
MHPAAGRAGHRLKSLLLGRIVRDPALYFQARIGAAVEKRHYDRPHNRPAVTTHIRVRPTLAPVIVISEDVLCAPTKPSH